MKAGGDKDCVFLCIFGPVKCSPIKSEIFNLFHHTDKALKLSINFLTTDKSHRGDLGVSQKCHRTVLCYSWGDVFPQQKWNGEWLSCGSRLGLCPQCPKLCTSDKSHYSQQGILQVGVDRMAAWLLCPFVIGCRSSTGETFLFLGSQSFCKTIHTFLGVRLTAMGLTSLCVALGCMAEIIGRHS